MKRSNHFFLVLVASLCAGQIAFADGTPPAAAPIPESPPKHRQRTFEEAKDMISGLSDKIIVTNTAPMSASMTGVIPGACAKYFDLNSLKPKVEKDPANKSDATKNTVTFALRADPRAKACLEQHKDVDCEDSADACIKLSKHTTVNLSELEEYAFTVRFLDNVSQDGGEKRFSLVQTPIEGRIARARREITTQAATACRNTDSAAAIAEYTRLSTWAGQVDASLKTALDQQLAARVASDKSKASQDALAKLKAELEAVASLADYESIDRIVADLRTLHDRDLDEATKTDIDALLATVNGKRVAILSTALSSAKELDELEKLQKYLLDAIKPGSLITLADKKEIEKVLTRLAPKITAKISKEIRAAKTTDDLEALEGVIASTVKVQQRYSRLNAEKTEKLHDEIAVRGVSMIEREIGKIKPEKDEDGGSFIARVEEVEARGLDWVDSSDNVSPTARARLLYASANKKASAPAEDLGEAIDNVLLAEETLALACEDEDCDARLALSVEKRINEFKKKRGIALARTGDTSVLAELWQNAQATTAERCYGVKRGSFLGMDGYSQSNGGRTIEDSIACATATENVRDLHQVAMGMRQQAMQQQQQQQRSPMQQPLDPLAPNGGGSMFGGMQSPQASGFPASYSGTPNFALASASGGIMGSSMNNPFATMSMQ